MGGADSCVRRYRLGVHVLSGTVSSLPGSAWLKLALGCFKTRTATVRGPQLEWDFYTSFEVESVDTDELSLTLLAAGSLGQAVLGRLALPAKSALWTPGEALPTPVVHKLLSLKASGPSPGEVTLRIILVAAPEQSSPLRVLAASWNVGNATPCDDLGPWLRNSDDSAELVFVGAQECHYTPHATKDKALRRHTTRGNWDGNSTLRFSPCEDDWVNRLGDALGDSYSLVRSDCMGQMRLALFARFDCRAGITSSECGREATGLGHVHTNKGGVATSLELWDTRLCCVNTHLAAHQGAVKRRNSDYSEIVQGIQMGVRGQDMMNQWEHLIWLGDLNYRLDLSDMFGEEAATAKTPPSELFDTITQLAEQRDFRELAQCDQLGRVRARGDAFVGFQEGVLCHEPTFKVKRAKGLQYNTQRSPAYCDRILWRSLPGATASQEALWAAPECDSSDHKPVAAMMLLSRQPVRPVWVPRPSHGLPHPRLSLRDALARRQNAAPPLMTWSLQLLTLFGHDLLSADFNGLSDPYVAFMGACMPRMAVTDVVFATLDPVWSLDKLPTLTLAAPSEEALRTERILIQAVDYDATSMDDPIGCGVLPLGPLLEQASASSDGTAEFECPLTWAGLSQGYLNGRVRLSQGPAMAVRSFLDEKRKSQYVAPRKKFTFARALGLIKDAPPKGGEQADGQHGRASSSGDGGAAGMGCGCFAPPQSKAALAARKSSAVEVDEEELEDD